MLLSQCQTFTVHPYQDSFVTLLFSCFVFLFSFKRFYLFVFRINKMLPWQETKLKPYRFCSDCRKIRFVPQFRSLRLLCYSQAIATALRVNHQPISTGCSFNQVGVSNYIRWWSAFPTQTHELSTLPVQEPASKYEKAVYFSTGPQTVVRCYVVLHTVPHRYTTVTLDLMSSYVSPSPIWLESHCRWRISCGLLPSKLSTNQSGYAKKNFFIWVCSLNKTLWVA